MKRKLLSMYKVTEKNNGFIIFQYKTIYLYLMYFIFLILISGFFTKIVISYIGIIIMFLYFVFISLPNIKIHRKIRIAMKEKSVELSGSKWSFSKPLTIKMRNDFD